jgi:hypothetical protein
MNLTPCEWFDLGKIAAVVLAAILLPFAVYLWTDLDKKRKSMRIMSFRKTVEQIRNRSKDVTRRVGWVFLQPSEKLRAVDKSPRLGEGYETLAIIRVVKIHSENLERITQEDVVREGFPEMTREEFIEMFCETANCERNQVVQRIEFEYLEEEFEQYGNKKEYSLEAGV